MSADRRSLSVTTSAPPLGCVTFPGGVDVDLRDGVAYVSAWMQSSGTLVTHICQFSVLAADPGSADLHLTELGPVILVDCLADDARCLDEVSGQRSDRCLEVIGLHVRSSCLAVAEGLDEYVLCGVG